MNQGHFGGKTRKPPTRRDFALQFCENGVVAKTSPRNVGDSSFWNHKRAKLSSSKTNASSSSLVKSKMKLPGVLESKGP